MKKNILYGIFALSLAAGFTSCDPVDGDDHSLSGVVINQDNVKLDVTKVSDKLFTLTNNSAEVPGVVYYLCTDGKTVKEFPVGSTADYPVKKNGVYKVVLSAVSGKDMKDDVKELVVDWFDETVKVDPQWLGYTAGTNLFKDANTEISSWFSGPNDWNGIAAPEIDGDIANGITFTMNGAGTDQWKAQVALENTGIKISAGKSYDFSVAIISSADFMGATVKPQKQDDNGVLFSEKRWDIKAGVNVITLNNCAGFDGNFKLQFDFAGAPEGTVITAKNFYIAEHSDENVALDEPVCFFDYSSDANLLKDKEADTTPSWWAAAGWAQIATPDIDGNAGTYELTIPEGIGSDQWMGQAKFAYGDVTMSASKTYDLSVVIISDKDLPGVTFKPQARNADDKFFYEGRQDVKAGVPFTFTLSDVAGFDDTFLFTFDFGGSPAGANVKIVGQYLAEHK